MTYPHDQGQERQRPGKVFAGRVAAPKPRDEEFGVIATIGFDAEALEMMGHYLNDRGQVWLKIKTSQRTGKRYAEIDTYEPGAGRNPPPAKEGAVKNVGTDRRYQADDRPPPSQLNPPITDDGGDHDDIPF